MFTYLPAELEEHTPGRDPELHMPKILFWKSGSKKIHEELPNPGSSGIG